MKFILLIAQLMPIFSLKLCINCKHQTKGTCSLFPILRDETHETEFLSYTRARKNHYFCGEKGRFYEHYDKNEPLDLPDDYDFETYIQLL
jgi:hypothetical protein